MLGRLGGTLTGLAMSGVLVSDSEFTQVGSNHIEFDIDRHVILTVVNTNDSSNHRWKDDAVSKSGSDQLRLFSGGLKNLSLLNLFQKLEVWSLESLGSKNINF